MLSLRVGEQLRRMKMKPPVAMLLGFAGAFLMAYTFSHVLTFGTTYMGSTELLDGVSTGFWMWLGFVAPVTAGVFLWEGKPLKLWLLNASYWLVSLVVMGAILVQMM